MNLFHVLPELTLPVNPSHCWLLTLCLLHTLWQGALVGLLVAGVVRLKQVSVHRRFAFAFGLLMLLGAMPILNFAWLARTTSPPQSVELATEHFLTVGGLRLFELNELARTNSDFNPTEADRSYAANGDASISEQQSGTSNPNSFKARMPAVSKSPFAWSVIAPAVLTLLYVAGVLGMILRLGFGLKSQWSLTRVCKKMKFAEQVSVLVLNTADRAASQFGRKLRTPIVLFYGDGAALVVGCLRPVIFLNASLVSGLTPVQLEQILAHELAHIYRFDPLTQLIQRLIESVLFFHPGVWYVSRQVSDLRELCCDELAARNYSRVDFAETLLQCAVLNRAPKVRPRYSLAAMGSRPSQLAARIDALLHPSEGLESHRFRGESRTSVRVLTIVLLAAMLLATLGIALTIRKDNPIGIRPAVGSSSQPEQSAYNASTVKPVVWSDVDWKWVNEQPELIKPGRFLFGGRLLAVSEAIPEDVDIQAMVVEEACRFSQWHFGDFNSTRVAVVMEMEGQNISRLFIDRNRDRVIEDSEVVTLNSSDGKTWITDLEVEVHERGAVVHAKRQIGITPNRDKSKIRITTLGFATGEIVLDGETLAARRVDKDGNGLPTDSMDQIWIDLNHDGEFDKLTEQLKLDSTLKLRKKRFLVRSDRLGQTLDLTPDDKRGFAQFHFELADKSAILETFEGSFRDESGMLISVRLSGAESETRTPVPVGKYCLQDLVIQVRDQHNAVWRMTLSRGLDRNWDNVKPDEMIEIKQDETQNISLLEDLDFQFISFHAPGYLGHETHLRPFIVTKRGLAMTDFVHEKPNEQTSPFNGSVKAKFKINDAAGIVADAPSCSSGFG